MAGPISRGKSRGLLPNFTALICRVGNCIAPLSGAKEQWNGPHKSPGAGTRRALLGARLLTF